MHDAFAALGKLATHPRIDPARIAVMGFSKGAVAAIYSSNERFRAAYGPSNAEFAAHIGLYTPCNVTYKQDNKVGTKSIRFFHGIIDDYVSIEPCRSYVKRLKEAGADVTLTEYPDAYHAYDNLTLGNSVALPNAQTTRNCLIVESENGTMLNSRTNQPYSLDDACVERGPHIGYNETAHIATVEAVKQFLASLSWRVTEPSGGSELYNLTPSTCPVRSIVTSETSAKHRGWASCGFARFRSTPKPLVRSIGIRRKVPKGDITVRTGGLQSGKAIPIAAIGADIAGKRNDRRVPARSLS
jgi:dienelactone hydrolase